MLISVKDMNEFHQAENYIPQVKLYSLIYFKDYSSTSSFYYKECYPGQNLNWSWLIHPQECSHRQHIIGSVHLIHQLARL